MLLWVDRWDCLFDLINVLLLDTDRLNLGFQVVWHLWNELYELSKGVLGGALEPIVILFDHLELVLVLTCLTLEALKFPPTHTPYQPFVICKIMEVKALRTVLENIQAEVDQS